MAVANAKVTVGGTSGPLGILDGTDNSQKLIEAYGTIAIDASPSTYTTGGIPLVNAANVALNAWANEKIKASPIKASDTGPTPLIVYIESTTGSGFWYTYNSTTNKVQIFTTGTATQAPAAELANAAAIPAGVSGDSIFFEAKFVRR